MKLLFVCTGNTCRSPMAQALAQNVLFPGCSLRAASAGLFAAPGARLSPMAALILEKDYGISSFCHQSRPLTREMLEEADLVIAMTAGHQRKIQECFGLSGKIRSMPEDIPDPYGGTEEDYRRCASLILQNLKALVKEGVIHDETP